MTLMVLYGHKPTSDDDRFMKLAAESTEVLSNKLVTGGGVWVVDMFPFCALPPLPSPLLEAIRLFLMIGT